MAIFPTFFFTQCRPVKCLFRYSRTKKRFFRLQKQEGKTLEKLTFFQRKIDIFPKGLTHSFGSKMVIFATFIFQKIQAKNMSFTIFQNEKRLSRLQKKKKELQKLQKLTFFQRVNPWFSSKNGHFSKFFFRQYRPGKCLLRYSRTKKKNPFQAIERRNSKSRKIDIFPKGHGFSPKMAIFPNSFFQAIQARKMSFTIFYNQNNSFLGYKNNKFKKSKN